MEVRILTLLSIVLVAGGPGLAGAIVPADTSTSPADPAPPGHGWYFVGEDLATGDIVVEHYDELPEAGLVRPAHGSSGLDRSCTGVAPVITDCNNMWMPSSWWMVHGFFYPDCATAGLHVPPIVPDSSCYRGTLTSTLYGDTEVRTLTCDLVVLGDLNRTLTGDENASHPLDFDCETTGEAPYFEPFHQFCWSHEYETSLEDQSPDTEGGAGMWGCGTNYARAR